MEGLVAHALLFGVLLHCGLGEVPCYICSWSPRDNRSDQCTHGNFRSDAAPTLACKEGCEIYQVDDLNGEFQQMRRNCARNPPHWGCLTETSRLRTVIRCFCNKDYCNHSTHITPSLVIMLSLVLYISS